MQPEEQCEQAGCYIRKAGIMRTLVEHRQLDGDIHNTWYYFDGNNEQYPGLMVENCVKDIQGYKYHFSAGVQCSSAGYVIQRAGTMLIRVESAGNRVATNRKCLVLF